MRKAKARATGKLGATAVSSMDAGMGNGAAMVASRAVSGGGMGRARPTKAPMHRSLIEHANLLNADIIRQRARIGNGNRVAHVGEPIKSLGLDIAADNVGLERDEKKRVKLMEVLAGVVVFLVWDGMQLVNQFQQNWVTKVCTPPMTDC